MLFGLPRETRLDDVVSTASLSSVIVSSFRNYQVLQVYVSEIVGTNYSSNARGNLVHSSAKDPLSEARELLSEALSRVRLVAAFFWSSMVTI